MPRLGARLRDLAGRRRPLTSCGRQVPGVARRPERTEATIDLRLTGAVEGLGNPVADPLEDSHVARHARELIRRGVNPQLLRPEAEARGVDLGRSSPGADR